MSGELARLRGISPAKILTVFRVGSAGLLLGLGVCKFITDERSVVVFSTIGIPAAEAAVIDAGIVELLAAGLLLSNRFHRIGAPSWCSSWSGRRSRRAPPWPNPGLLEMVFGIIGFERAGATREVNETTG